MSELPQVNQEFITENLCKYTNQFMRKRGPKDRKARLARRNEVFRLHFLHGWSSIKIAKFMGIHRNTINDDVSFWYEQLAKEYDQRDIIGMFMKQILRLEDQRTELLEELKSSQDKLSIRKLIIDIDSRIMRFAITLSESQDRVIETITSYLNADAEKEGLKTRYISPWQISRLPKRTHDKIQKILDEG